MAIRPQTPQTPAPFDPLDEVEIVVTGNRPTARPQETRLERLSQESEDFGREARQAGLDYLQIAEQGIQTLNSEANQRATAAEAHATSVSQTTQRIQQRAERSLGQIEEGIEVRDAIIDRKGKVEKAFPLVRGIKSLFDPTWNLGTLRKGQREAEASIQRGVRDSAAISQVANQSLAAQSTEYSAGKEASLSRSDVAATSISSAVTQLQAVRENWQLTQNQIQTSVQNERALLEAEGMALAQQTDSDVMGLLDEASRSGSVVVNGTRIGLAALQDRAIKIEQQNRTIESAKLSLQSQRLGLRAQQLNLEGAARSEFLRTMSNADIELALANGGVFKGITFGVGELGERKAANDQALNYVAASKFQQVSVTGARESVTSAANYVGAVAGKAQEVFGDRNVPQSVRAAVVGASARINNLADQIRVAEQNPTDPTSAKTLELAHAQAQEEFEKITKAVDTAVKRMGGTAEQQASYRALMLGDSVDPGTAAVAMNQWANAGTLPDFLSRNPKTRQTFSAIQNAQAALAGTESFQRASAAQKRTMMSEEVGKAVRNSFVTPVSDETFENLPKALEAAGVDLGISPAVWASTTSAANSVATKNVATSIGVPALELDRAVRTGDYTKIEEQMRESGQTPQSIADSIRAAKVVATQALLEQTQTGLSGQLTDALANPEVQQNLGRIAEAAAGQDPGGDFMNLLTGGTISTMGSGIHQTIGEVQRQARAAELEALYEKTQAFGSNPIKRMEAQIMVSGMSPDRQQVLIGHIRQAYPRVADMNRRTGLFADNRDVLEGLDNRIRKDLANLKSEDAMLNAAAKEFTTLAPADPGVIERLVEWFRSE